MERPRKQGGRSRDIWTTDAAAVVPLRPLCPRRARTIQGFVPRQPTGWQRSSFADSSPGSPPTGTRPRRTLTLAFSVALQTSPLAWCHRASSAENDHPGKDVVFIGVFDSSAFECWSLAWAVLGVQPRADAAQQAPAQRISVSMDAYCRACVLRRARELDLRLERRLSPLDHPTTPLLALFSVLYSANIAASNASLRLVSIATHQVVRAATPLFVVLFASVGLGASGLGLGRRGVSSAKLKSLTPVVLGVVFATYGDYTYTRAGLALTLLGTALAALKTMLAARVVCPPKSPPIPAPTPHRATQDKAYLSRPVEDEGYLSGDERPTQTTPAELRAESRSGALHPLDVLFRLSPLACLQCLIVAWLSGEMGRWSQAREGVIGLVGDEGLVGLVHEGGVGLVHEGLVGLVRGELGTWRALAPALALNGALAFVLNYVSFVASRRAGALSMTVAANIKQVLTVLVALVVFDAVAPSIAHIVGIGLTLAGGVWYGLVEVRERERGGAEEKKKVKMDV